MYVCLLVKNKLNDTIKINFFRSCGVFLFQLQTDGFKCTIFRVYDTLKNLA